MMDAKELDILSKTERARVFEIAGGILALSVFLIAGAAIMGWTMQADLRWLIIALWVAGGLVAGILMVWGAFRVWGKLDGAEQERQTKGAVYFPEIETAPPAPVTLPTLPALPAESDTIRVTLNGRVGEDIPRDTVQGFDPRDLLYMFRALARGEKWTEANLEKWELPYSREVMGKAQEGTAYTRFIDVCIRAEIIGGREPKKSGVLLVAEPAEMMRRVKELQNTPTP
jgi:hypothetical protein